MPRARVTRLGLAVFALLLALWPVAAALAAQPVFVTIPLDEEFYYPAGTLCAVAVEGVTTGTLRIQAHFDQDGNLVVERAVAAHWSSRVFSPDTGISLFSPAGPEPITIRYHADGSFTFTYTGLNLVVIQPGGGQVGIGAGRLSILVTFDPVYQEQVIFEAGQHEVDVNQAACDALAG
jgi:hypothetical protein